MSHGKIVGGIPIEKWKLAFADAVNTAIDKDYFSDTLFFDLYPEHGDEDEDYEKMWASVDEAFKEVFGYDRHDCGILG